LILLNDDVIVLAASLVAPVVVLDWGEAATLLHRLEQIHAVLGMLGNRERVLDLLADLDETAGHSAANVNRFENLFFELTLKGSCNRVGKVQFSKLLVNCNRLFHFSGVSTAHPL
jgi:hypothetical protein